MLNSGSMHTPGLIPQYNLFPLLPTGSNPKSSSSLPGIFSLSMARAAAANSIFSLNRRQLLSCGLEMSPLK